MVRWVSNFTTPDRHKKKLFEKSIQLNKIVSVQHMNHATYLNTRFISRCLNSNNYPLFLFQGFNIFIF